MKTKKLLSVFITLAMLMSLLPIPVSAETDNKYVVRSLNGTKVTEELCDIPTATTLTNETSWGSGFYVASGELNLSAVTVTGDAKLILKDGCELTVTGGIAVNEGKSLEIFAQSGGTGSGLFQQRAVTDVDAVEGPAGKHGARREPSRLQRRTEHRERHAQSLPLDRVGHRAPGIAVRIAFANRFPLVELDLAHRLHTTRAHHQARRIGHRQEG